MKVTNNNTQEYYLNNTNTQESTSFKGGMPNMLNLSGNIMQSIENSGFLGSFLIQDFCGMTIPRTTAGFLRDKEYTGKYNTLEGIEVFGREGLTGPCMMAVAPLGLIIASNFGKSTSCNSELIKRFGDNLKEFIENKNFNKELLKDPIKFKQEYYKFNIQQILENTLGKEHATKENVEYVLKEMNNINNISKNAKFSKFSRKKSKLKKEHFNNISEFIDNIRYSTSSELDKLQKVDIGSTTLNNIKTFNTKNSFDAMQKYAEDAISNNKNLEKLDKNVAEKIKNIALGKRLVTNISLMAGTLGILSILPKIYAKNNVAPGARKNTENNVNDNPNNQINFKGKSHKGLLEKLGEKINKIKKDFVSNELEYNGHNFTNTLMAGLSIFGLLTPRGLRAYNRAQTDDVTGKKDLTELWEILIRDLTSSLAVVFAVPMLTRACVTSYEKHSGFVLMNKNRENQSKFKSIIDVINPYSKSHVLTNSELKSLYDNVNTKNKMLNFCKYIDKNNGDLQKILSKSENANLLFNNEFKLENLKKLNKKDKNNKIIEAIKKLDKKDANEIITKVMKATKSGKTGKIAAFARGLTSVPAALTTFFISPYLLGWFIPRLTYKNTRRIHDKQEKERNEILTTQETNKTL